MTLADFQALFGSWWPYAAVLVIGFLPTEMWRVLAVLLSSGLGEDSEALRWVRLVATTLLAAVVVKIVLTPTGALGSLPQWGRIIAIPAAVTAMFLFRRSVVAAVLMGEAVVMGSSLLAR